MAQPFPGTVWTITDASGNPVSGAKVYTYAAGPLTAKAVYTDASLATASSNPVIADTLGRVTFFMGSGAYRFRVFDASDVEITALAEDNISSDTSSIKTDLADPASATLGPALVSFNPALAYPAQTIGDHGKAYVTPRDFLAYGVAIGDTAIDETAQLSSFFQYLIDNPGVTGVMPRRLYGVSSELPTWNKSGIRCVGSGWSTVHNVGTISSQTTIKWLGSAGGTMMQAAPVAGGSNQFLTGLLLDGVFFDCNAVAGYGWIGKSFRNSMSRIGVSNAVTTAITLDVLPSASLGENEDTQVNIFDFAVRQVEAASGIALRLKGSATANISLNRFRFVDILHNTATAIIEENADNNVWEYVRCFAAGAATYSVEWGGGATESVSCRGELFIKFSANKPILAHGTGTYTYPATNNNILSSDLENGTPVPIYGTGATGVWTDTRGVSGGSGGGLLALGACLLYTSDAADDTR